MKAEIDEDALRITTQFRSEALRAVGHSWGEKRIAGNLPVFDWQSVALAMSAVRAI